MIKGTPHKIKTSCRQITQKFHTFVLIRFELIIYLPAEVKIILPLLTKKHQYDHIKTSVNTSKVASLTMKYQASVQQQQTIHDVQQQIHYIHV